MLVNLDKCLGCGACVKVCPRGAIQLLNGVARINSVLCTECGICARVCPNDAIQSALLTTPQPFKEALSNLKTQINTLREQARELTQRIDRLRHS